MSIGLGDQRCEKSRPRSVSICLHSASSSCGSSEVSACTTRLRNGLFHVGAFQGEKASDAYFVRCGLGDTMTQAEIDAGQVIVIVGFAPLKPAEFVIVRIVQKVNQM